MTRTPILGTALAALVLAHPGFAQDLTDEEMLRRFNSQREAFQEAESGGLGATRGLGTRGLSLVTINEGAVTTPGEVTVEGTGTTADAGQTGGPVDPNKPLVVGVLAQDLQVNLRIGFGFDSAAIAETEKPKLDQVCSVMKASDINLFRIIGHTDGSGSDEYNQRLSVLRAEEVARYLVSECGLAPSRLETMGLGERFLFDPSDPNADENRRVEFQAIS